MDVLILLILNHILPTIVGSALSLSLVLLFLGAFFIKRPSIRHAFLLIPLVKPLFMLIGGLKMTEIDEQAHPLLIRMQIPDPLDIIPVSLDMSHSSLGDKVPGPPGTTDLFLLGVITAVVLTASFLALHWIALLRCRKQLAGKEGLDQAKHRAIFNTLNNLSLKAGVKTPKLVFADTPCPFMIGIKNTAIILPNRAMGELTESEFEAILAHEIAHIKRKDNLWLWIAIVCRDLMFFNPIAWLAFRLLSVERERAADQLAAKITRKPIDLANSLIKIAEKLNSDTCAKPAWSVAKTNLMHRFSLEKRVNDLLNFKPCERLVLRKFPLIFLFIMLFYVRYIVSVRISEETFFSFFG